MRWTSDGLVQLGTAVIVVMAVLVSVRFFIAIDAASSSVGDTLLGFAPNDVVVWALAAAGIWVLRRASTRSS